MRYYPNRRACGEVSLSSYPIATLPETASPSAGTVEAPAPIRRRFFAWSYQKKGRTQ